MDAPDIGETFEKGADAAVNITKSAINAVTFPVRVADYCVGKTPVGDAMSKIPFVEFDPNFPSL